MTNEQLAAAMALAHAADDLVGGYGSKNELKKASAAFWQTLEDVFPEKPFMSPRVDATPYQPTQDQVDKLAGLPKPMYVADHGNNETFS